MEQKIVNTISACKKTYQACHQSRRRHDVVPELSGVEFNDLENFFKFVGNFVPHYSLEEKAIVYGVTGGVAKYLTLKKLDDCRCNI